MTRIVLLSLLLSACVSTHGPSLHQATAPVYRPPPVTHTFPSAQSHVPAGAGASHGALAAPEKSSPRSQNKRLLPPTKEMGLWAADGAPSGAIYTDKPLFSIPIPLPDDVWEMDGRSANACVSSITTAASKTATQASRLPETARACMAARAIGWCLDFMRVEAETASTSTRRHGWRPHKPTSTIQAYFSALVARWCHERDLTREEAETLARIMEQWEWIRRSDD